MIPTFNEFVNENLNEGAITGLREFAMEGEFYESPAVYNNFLEPEFQKVLVKEFIQLAKKSGLIEPKTKKMGQQTQASFICKAKGFLYCPTVCDKNTNRISHRFETTGRDMICGAFPPNTPDLKSVVEEAFNNKR